MEPKERIFLLEQQMQIVSIPLTASPIIILELSVPLVQIDPSGLSTLLRAQKK